VGATRFFVSGIFALGDIVELAAADARKLAVVLRAESGDAIEIVDSSGKSYAATLSFEGLRVSAVLERELSMPAPLRLKVTLAQGLPKGQKMDFIVEKTTELGIARLVPFVSSRTAGDGARTGKVERWRRLARAAAQQSGRSDIPDVDDPVDFGAVVALVPAVDLTLVPWELAHREPLRERLPALLASARSVLVAIGPEGGLSADEAGALEEAGAHLISLGSRILRTETAGLVACTALLYASGDV
jgi:16S rRNA (uracil1498-N3)-methyltransferase